MHTVIFVDITFDPNKDRFNVADHGVSLALAEKLEWDLAEKLEWDLAEKLEWDLMVCREDDRENYGEFRLQCFAPIADQLYCVICIEDDDRYRIISL